ncbi:hypothetical protein EDB81DRAFT_852200 [Dactylonectria macrodidyma]|uniref:Lysine-specific metallo-endopeptidase domain-containing protein n=1 Tax=Dactylonectria macrodidyma TaxID=307937 RepID=A0A9P9FLN5_9HYPO|nr:hypothetical protein EDB81DRAFT_852200 [Dactylonectria macrodidyma]
MMLNLYLYLSFVQVALGANRYIIDTDSCLGEVFTKLQYCTDAAIARAGLVADVLRPYIQDRNNKPDDRIMKQMTRLFGNDDVSTAYDIFARFDAVRQYVRIDMDSRSEQWKQIRDKSDLEIHCNADYIIPDSSFPEPNIHWIDDIQKLPVRDTDAILEFKGEKSTSQAVTSPARAWKVGEVWPDNVPELITFDPEWIQTAVAKNSIFNSDRVKKAVHPSLRRNIQVKFQRFTDITNIDVLQTLEFTLLHELMHTAVGGLALDMDDDDSYGWVNCRRLKDTNNAESLAFFGLVIDLIQNHKYDVNDKGSLKSIT